VALRSVVAACFLLAQLVLVVVVQSGPSRYVGWAPNDYVTDYVLQVSVNGRPLAADEILARYRQPPSGRFENEPRHLMDLVEQYEQTYGRGDATQVVMRYRLNGHAEQQWRWPNP
jgi:hypothetical protein